MRTHFTRHFALDVRRELRRIGVDEERLPALMIQGSLSSADFLRWLQTIPGASGHEYFLSRLQAPPDRGGPHAPGPDELPAPDIASHPFRSGHR